MNYNQKNIVFLIGFILLVVMAYQLSFSKTTQIKKQYINLKFQDDQFALTSKNTNYLQNQHKYYDSILTKFQVSSEISFQHNLLNKLHQFSKKNNLKIRNFEQPHIINLNKTTRQETYQFKVEGNYTSIIALIYNLEQTNKMGKIISSLFEKKKDYRTSKESLLCTILLQKIIQE